MRTSILRAAAGAWLALAACGRDPEPTLVERLAHGAWAQHEGTRDGYGGLKVRLRRGTRFTLESLRGPGWGWRRRLVASDSGGATLWRYEGAPDEFLTDFALHPSGDVTLALERAGVERGAYELVRLDADGQVRARGPLPLPATLPAQDRAGTALLDPPFRMRSTWGFDALGAGWLRVEPRGEDLAAAFVSWLEVLDPARDRRETASAVMALGWDGTAYAEQWTRVVDGRHTIGPVAWAYDEFGWREATARVLLAVADDDGSVLVGRTWTTQRCTAELVTFDRGAPSLCESPLASYPVEVEYQPFAVTTFSAAGARGPTRVHAPRHLAELVVFDMAVHGTGLVLVGSAVVDQDGLGGKAYYPPAPGAEPTMTPYDAYLAAFDRGTGALRFERLLDAGRAEHLSSVRWTGDGIVAAGGAGWDRWYGGMSISRGAEPVLAYVSADGTRAWLRHGTSADRARHAHLLGVDVEGGRVDAVGLADAPLTHSGDGGHPEAMTFAPLDVRL